MKLESFKDKKGTRRKMIFISLGVITIIGVSLLLYKTYTQFNGKVNLDNNDVLFGFYNGNTRLDDMPQKGNADNLVFEKAECDNGASVEWNEEKWAPLVKGLTKKKTKCTLYFNKKTGVKLLEEKAQEEQTKEEPELMYDDTEDKNLRYVGDSPNNYIDIGDRDSDGQPILWRIIGVMKNVVNVETNKKENLIKIIRDDNIGWFSWDTSKGDVNVDENYEVNDGFGVNEWSQADIMKLLNPGYSDNQETLCIEYANYVCSSYDEILINNSLYWNNDSGQCFDGYDDSYESCDFKSSGISEEAKNKIAKVRWNTGTFATDDNSKWTANATYKAERGNIDGKQYCLSQGEGNECNDEIERTTTWDGYIGLINASDYGYAIGKSVRSICLAKSMYNYGYDEDDCSNANWLKPSSIYFYKWTLNPVPYESNAGNVFLIGGSGFVNRGYAGDDGEIYPVVYLKQSTTISDAAGTFEDPFVAF